MFGIVYRATPSQMTVTVTAHACSKWCYALGINTLGVAYSMTANTHRTPTTAAVCHGLVTAIVSTNRSIWFNMFAYVFHVYSV